MNTLTYTAEQQAANRGLWADALESDDYDQARDALVKVEHDEGWPMESFCCLAVACETAIKVGVPWLRRTPGSTLYEYLSPPLDPYSEEPIEDAPLEEWVWNEYEDGELPLPMVTWLGVADSAVHTKEEIVRDDEGAAHLIELNDHLKLNFSEIAQVIRDDNIRLVP